MLKSRPTLVKSSLLTLVLALSFAGCATPTLESRKKERLAAYNALSPEMKQLVDKRLIKIGMSSDAVYISWGPPSEILESETAQGHETTWIYQGQWMEESRYWTYREVPHNGNPFLERHLESDYTARNYIKAEIVFSGANPTVVRWRTLPMPR